MIILMHVLVALGSIGYTAYAFIFPTQTKLNVSYGLVAFTIASGTYLIVLKPGHMLEACTLGIAYCLFAIFGIAHARRKLATENQ